MRLRKERGKWKEKRKHWEGTGKKIKKLKKREVSNRMKIESRKGHAR